MSALTTCNISSWTLNMSYCWTAVTTSTTPVVECYTNHSNNTTAHINHTPQSPLLPTLQHTHTPWTPHHGVQKSSHTPGPHTPHSSLQCREISHETLGIMWIKTRRQGSYSYFTFMNRGISINGCSLIGKIKIFRIKLWSNLVTILAESSNRSKCKSKVTT